MAISTRVAGTYRAPKVGAGIPGTFPAGPWHGSERCGNAGVEWVDVDAGSWMHRRWAVCLACSRVLVVRADFGTRLEVRRQMIAELGQVVELVGEDDGAQGGQAA